MSPVLRRARDGVFWSLCVGALLLLVAPALAIVGSLLQQAWPVLTPRLLTAGTAAGGLQNALLGTLLLCAGVAILAGPVGIAAGIYLAEFGPRRRVSWLRLASETLAGIPSIVVGYVAYVVLDQALHWGYSLLAGILALSALVLPYIVKTTEVALRQVPTTLRDGAAALGLPRLTTLRRVLLPPAIPGIASGLLVALAISVGETAPLLYTVGFSDGNPAADLFRHPVGYLTYVVYLNATLPTRQEHQVAAAAGVMIVVLLLLLIAAGRAVARRAARHAARMPV
ncbi:MAG TPA: phosphate ABC transporter permease PstA [Candidatus Micrarchaeia archaeon]|nr:phosphate ABC transporter permease PstA [Candidatus Micrarchaeia archaeon]